MKLFPINRETVFSVLFTLIIFVLHGCGSIHICSRTHTHFYGNECFDTDESSTDNMVAFIKFLRGRINAEAEPMKDFRWTEKRGSNEEDEF